MNIKKISLDSIGNAKNTYNSEINNINGTAINYCITVVHLYLPIFIYKAFKSKNNQICTVCNIELKKYICLILDGLGINFEIKTFNYPNYNISYYQFNLISKKLRDNPTVHNDIKEEVNFIDNNIETPLKNQMKEVDLSALSNGDTFLNFYNPQNHSDDIDNSLFLSLESVILQLKYLKYSYDSYSISKLLITQAIYLIVKKHKYLNKQKINFESDYNKAYLYSSILRSINVSSKITFYKDICFFEVNNSKVSHLSKDISYKNLSLLNLFDNLELDNIINNSNDINNGKDCDDFILINADKLLNTLGIDDYLLTYYPEGLENPTPLSFFDKIKKLF